MLARPVRIYSTHDVPRLRYIADIILGDILGLSWEVITDKRKLGKHPVINYSNENIAGSFKIVRILYCLKQAFLPGRSLLVNGKDYLYFSRLHQIPIFPLIFLLHHFFLSAGMRNILNISLMNMEGLRPPHHWPLRTDFFRIPVIDMWVKRDVKGFS